MIGIDQILSPENQTAALASFRLKNDGQGPDGMRVSELDEYWKANGERVTGTIRDGSYRPGIVLCYDITARSGKLREIANINVKDRLVEKLVQRVLQAAIEPTFLPSSFAYQEGKSALDAAMLARSCVEQGRPYVCEIDLKDYFTTIPHSRLLELLGALGCDEMSLELVRQLISRPVEREGKVEVPSKGLLQGSAISPVLANLYLNSFDQYLERRGLSWFRFSDNICAYCQDAFEASEIFEELTGILQGTDYRLTVNTKKSGVYEAINRRVLGYDLVERDGIVEVRRHAYKPARQYSNWHASSVYRRNDSFHIVQDGILNRQDWSLLFENDEERHGIPVEVTEQINVYGDVTVSSAALATLCRHNIRLCYVNRYGDLMGTFTPTDHRRPAEAFLKQCELYSDGAVRLSVARSLEIAGMHNMRANLRYYDKRGRCELDESIAYLSECIVEANECLCVGELRLVEARARKRYYSTFAGILEGTSFDFEKRTRRPPTDPGNALVSFGNTVLYNYVLQCIWKTQLDPKIGVVHATNRRSFSLNLDVADVFKPIIVDRVIFSLVNRHEISAADHFRPCDGGIVLNVDGKRVFLGKLEEKLETPIAVDGHKRTYRRIIADEVQAFQRLVLTGERYQPYKYY